MGAAKNGCSHEKKNQQHVQFCFTMFDMPYPVEKSFLSFNIQGQRISVSTLNIAILKPQGLRQSGSSLHLGNGQSRLINLQDSVRDDGARKDQ